jgi:hypothetical protein
MRAPRLLLALLTLTACAAEPNQDRAPDGGDSTTETGDETGAGGGDAESTGDGDGDGDQDGESTGDGDGDGDGDATFEVIDLPRAVDLTPDGSTALLESVGATVDAWLYDTDSGELENVAVVGDPAKDFSTGISGDLRISALHGTPVRAGVWSEPEGWLDLPDPFDTGCDLDRSTAFDLSHDGSVVVGSGWNGCVPQAARWIGGQIDLLEVVGESPMGSQNPPVNRASAVSGDGMVAVGFAQLGALDRSAARWEADGSGLLLNPEENDWPSEALSVNYDGTVVAGTRGYDGFVWTPADGIQSLGALPNQGVDETFPTAMIADGSAIYGAVGDPWETTPTAFVWTATDGMRPLTDLLEDAGITVPPGVLPIHVLAVSDDGRVLLGLVQDAGGVSSFVARLTGA